jgi:hypothetical protein
MTEEKGGIMQRYHQQRIKTNVATVVSILFLSDCLLGDCPKFYLSVKHKFKKI